MGKGLLGVGNWRVWKRMRGGWGTSEDFFFLIILINYKGRGVVG